jgi:hypothetical protein
MLETARAEAEALIDLVCQMCRDDRLDPAAASELLAAFRDAFERTINATIEEARAEFVAAHTGEIAAQVAAARAAILGAGASVN